ncbi:hypothetical protein [Paenibacillus sp. DMB20]|nr:hypothetical protein [Paenibacillus sp. DMB20]
MKKPTYQKWLFVAVIAVLLTGALGCSNGPKQQADPVSQQIEKNNWTR